MTSPAATPGAGPTADEPVPVPVKIVVAGGFGAGKSTLIHAVSEIPALSVGGAGGFGATGASPGTASPTPLAVQLDYGRVTLGTSIALHLFSVPGVDRFGLLWDGMFDGATGAVVVVDSHRLDAAFAAIDRLEAGHVPFVVAVNAFDGRLRHQLEAVRTALALPGRVAVTAVDARDRRQVTDLLVLLLEQVIAAAGTGPAA